MTYWVWGQGPQRGVFRFDYRANAWDLYDGSWPVPNNPSRMIQTAYDERVDRFVVAFNGLRWFLYNPARTGGRAWTEITATVPADLKVYCGGGKTMPCFAGSMTFDATNQRTIVLGHDPGRVLTLWAFDAIADTWTKLPLTNPPTGVSAGMGEYGHLHYDSSTASLFFLGAHNGNAWSGGSAGNVNLWQITLDLGTPLPTPVQQDAPQ
jgi:hypothetical protein